MRGRPFGRRRQPSDPGRDVSPRPACDRGRLSHVRALAAGKLLQVPARRIRLDALVDYQLDTADAQRDVPNPTWNKVDAKLRQARNEVVKLSARYGIEALGNREAKRRTMRGFKIATAKLASPVKDALRRYARLEAQRAKVPRRIPVGKLVAGDVVQLATERKHLTE
jgi:hypothetical protein